MTKSQNIEGRLVSATTASVVATILTGVQALIQVPLVLKYWGPEAFGIWTSIFALVALILSLDYGHHVYVGNQLCQDAADGDIHRMRETLGSSLKVAALLGLFELGFGILLITHTSLIGGENGPLTQEGPAIKTATALLLFCSIIGGSIGGILVRLYLPFGLYARSQWIGVLSRALLFILFVVCLIGELSLVETMLVYILGVVVINTFLFVDLRRLVNQMYPWWEYSDLRLGWQNLKLSTILTMNNLGDQLALHGLALAVGFMLGPMGVAGYMTLRTVANSGAQFAAVFLTPLTLDIVKSYKAGEGSRLAELFKSTWFILNSITTIFVSGLLWATPYLYEKWTGNALLLDRSFLTGLLASVIVRQWSAPLVSYLCTLNRLRAQTTIAIARTLGVATAVLLLFLGCSLASVGIGATLGEIAAATIALNTVQKEMKNLGSLIPGKFLVASWVQLIACGAVLCVFAFYEDNLLLISSLSVTVVILAAWFQWRMLKESIQVRISNFIGSHLKSLCVSSR